MALTNPRIYQWHVGDEPFVGNETRMYVTDSLRAADNHAIPFPRRLYQSEHYSRADRIRVQLMIQTDNQPFPGASYVMTIDVTGRNQSIREQASEWMEDRIRDQLTPEALGPGGLIFDQMADPTNTIGGFTHWNARVRLIEVDSVEQVAGGGTRVTGRVRAVTVRYEVITPGEDRSRRI